MKTLREYIDLVDSAQEPVDESWKSAAAGAALAATTALGSPNVNADPIDRYFARQDHAQTRNVIQRIREILKAHGITGQNISYETKMGKIDTVTVDGKTYKFNQPLELSEEELSEDGSEDPIAKIDRLFKDS